jgi:hypothetical protein
VRAGEGDSIAMPGAEDRRQKTERPLARLLSSVICNQKTRAN